MIDTISDSEWFQLVVRCGELSAGVVGIFDISGHTPALISIPSGTTATSVTVWAVPDIRQPENSIPVFRRDGTPLSYSLSAASGQEITITDASDYDGFDFFV